MAQPSKREGMIKEVITMNTARKAILVSTVLGSMATGGLLGATVLAPTASNAATTSTCRPLGSALVELSNDRYGARRFALAQGLDRDEARVLGTPDVRAFFERHEAHRLVEGSGSCVLLRSRGGAERLHLK